MKQPGKEETLVSFGAEYGAGVEEGMSGLCSPPLIFSAHFPSMGMAIRWSLGVGSLF